MKYLLLLLGAVLAYECAAKLAEYNRQQPLWDDRHAEARRDRVRRFHQQGQEPGSFEY